MSKSQRRSKVKSLKVPDEALGCATLSDDLKTYYKIPNINADSTKSQCEEALSNLVNNSIWHGESRQMIKDSCPHIVKASVNLIDTKAGHFLDHCLKG